MSSIPLLIAEGAGPIADIANRFSINFPTFFAQCVSFLVVLALLYFFAFKKILDTIDARQQTIAGGVRYAEEMKQKLADAEQQQQQTLKKASDEAQRLIDEARATSQELVEKQTREAAEQSEEIIRRGQESIELEHKKMLSEARSEIARLVVATTSRVLGKELTDEERSRYGTTAAEDLVSKN